jgi:hypothetical protein
MERKLSLAQMVRFLVVESTHLDLNIRFSMCIAYLWLIILSVVGDISVDGETFLVTDFVNLKIKPTQSFKCAHRDRMHMHVFIE